jgi:FkbM family methyltransferase
MPCVFTGVGGGVLSLTDKFQVASARDVFLSANYWRLFEHLESQPKLIVDLGSNCGHFTVLMHLLILEKFGTDDAKYFLFEPVKQLANGIKKTLRDAGILDRAIITNAAVGQKFGFASLTMNTQNLLTTTVAPSGSSDKSCVEYADPLKIIPAEQTIDVLKVDIEGSEYDLWKYSPEIFDRSNIVAIELHGAQAAQQELIQALKARGLHQRSTNINYGTATMMILSRNNR